MRILAMFMTLDGDGEFRRNAVLALAGLGAAQLVEQSGPHEWRGDVQAGPSRRLHSIHSRPNRSPLIEADIPHTGYYFPRYQPEKTCMANISRLLAL